MKCWTQFFGLGLFCVSHVIHTVHISHPWYPLSYMIHIPNFFQPTALLWAYERRVVYYMKRKPENKYGRLAQTYENTLDKQKVSSIMSFIQ